MAHQNRRLCEFFNKPGGCYKKDKCRFVHDATRSSVAGPSPASPPRQPGGASPRRGSPTQHRSSPGGSGVSRAPRGICDFYWSTGSCARGFDCGFKHQQRTLADGQGVSERDDEEVHSISLPELPASSVSSHYGHYNLSPSNIHNSLQDYLGSSYVDKPLRIAGFARALGSVNAYNKSWNSETAQDLLTTIVKPEGNGLVRIAEILRFENVSFVVGVRTDALSFQRGYFPVLEFLSTDLILKSTLHHNINALYAILEANYESVHETILACVGGMVAARTWKDPEQSRYAATLGPLNGVVVFQTLATLFYQYFTRFKQAIRNHPQILDMIRDLQSWFTLWSSDVLSASPRFSDDPIVTCDRLLREQTLGSLEENVARLASIVARESTVADRLRKPITKPTVSLADKEMAFMNRIQQAYIPPGTLRVEGPRHDNDFVEISNIRIAPTHDELMGPLPPYLPFFVEGAPHHLPPKTMERHLDIQFRLLREELISSLRESLSWVSKDLDEMFKPGPRPQKRPDTILDGILKKKGGAYRTSGRNSVFFQVYTNAEFTPVKAERRNCTVGLSLDPPPSGGARDPSPKVREEFWRHSKRLGSGSLVALVLVRNKSAKIFLGTVMSFGQDIADSSKVDAKRIQIRVLFFDAEVEMLALRPQQTSKDPSNFALLVDNNVMFESVRPFLETLKTVEPTSIPFSRYICGGSRLEAIEISPPKYAMSRQFRFNLQCLAKPGEVINPLDVSNVAGVVRAREELRRSSQLDPSQADAVVDTLIREVSLIQGPPGTGKSFTGKEILRTLFASKIKPIVLIAFTNHALDHMISSILDAGITNRLVRLGSRSSDERVSEYSLDKLEKLDDSGRDRSIAREFAQMKNVEKDMIRVMDSIQVPTLTYGLVEHYLEVHYPEHMNNLISPPDWIDSFAQKRWDDDEENGQWINTKDKKKKKSVEDDTISRSFYGFWRSGADIEFIVSLSQQLADSSTPAVQSQGPENGISRVQQILESFGLVQIPKLPSGRRGIDALLGFANVWALSLEERTRLSSAWEGMIRTEAYNQHLWEYEDLRRKYNEACERYNEVRDENRRRLLSKIDLIGCTTTGAAKLTSLLANIAPRVLMLEEAGQVLEAHVLAALVPSVQHLICIGDPQQLRPTLATFSLSMDSERGRELFKLDRSLMERLSNSGLPMSQINVQRRMRPSISHLIRTILYPNLADHDVVLEYPTVQCMQSNVFFLNHTNPENSGEDSVSKYNMFEAEMIRDLVLYFLKQGPYSGPGDIAVLCAYLGQLQKVRAALRDLKIAVSVDERDEQELARQGVEEESGFDQVVVAKHIRLGTVDIFQGQEAKIVIVSLVRNTGSFETSNAPIGFLKSSNRINVALSRAKHGLYIMGNASNLRQNSTWRVIVEQLEDRDQVGPALPIVCPRHPEQTRLVSKPGDIPAQAPQGGCLLPCAFRLSCGHNCPSACHADLDNHRSTLCDQPCPKVPCPQGHPCVRRCFEDCGPCQFPYAKVKLPCGHIAKSKIPCHQMDNLAAIPCRERVVKRLPHCEHSAKVQCHQDPATVVCKETCNGQMGCCSRTCKSRCSDCQYLSRATPAPNPQGPVARSRHRPHPCERSLYCEHRCGLDCSERHECSTDCRQSCRQICSHHTCPKPCSDPCPPCMEPCGWRCIHHSCPVACGSICSRLPCDEPCPRTLRCTHPCPSVCGEPCSNQACVICLPEDRKEDIVDFIMQRRLSEIDVTSTDVSDRLITLQCGHVFTVETLDGHCSMGEYYEVDAMGHYISPKQPPIEYQTPPVCPTCRGPITSPRYGRVTKRANLDILERNVASNMAKQLNPELQVVNSNVSDMEEATKELKVEEGFRPEGEFQALADARRKLFGKDDEPLPPDLFFQQGLRSIHGFSSAEAKAWYQIIRPLVLSYGKVTRIARTRFPHVHAYEASVTTLYRLELESIRSDPERACEDAEQVALHAISRKIGQSPPKADRKFHVEAFLLSIELRCMIAQIAQARISALTEPNSHHRRLWTSFVQFIYESCLRDSHKALWIAESTSASRQAARASIIIMRAETEKFRFDTVMECDAHRRGGRLPQEDRDRLLGEVKLKQREMMSSFRKIEQTYLRSRPSQTMEDVKGERAWFKDNCSQKGNRYIREFEDLKEHIMTDKGYEPLSLQEREDIVKALSFTHRGHFYQCENGHPFVIGECGGATQASRCPECGAPIGGHDHQLLASNTRAREFEDIARRQGSLDPAFPWTRGA
ncbi:hypothetical protein JAAARDRAFT_202408 [Jaapia argillacea MUCL 33604]|uniref:NFX1-type zinc finger-containing protein 1 n=1 Tax=Jaapia argillacea MUCL 33604 TaxID=933084 RepID=A0A067QJR7_9AGAM|nr:hypothetical protein JAAARDRAFT_202408 [Jaapia argillacea MUCL 33604]